MLQEAREKDCCVKSLLGCVAGAVRREIGDNVDEDVRGGTSGAAGQRNRYLQAEKGLSRGLSTGQVFLEAHCPLDIQ